MNHGGQASQERDDAHELAESLRDQALEGRQHLDPMERYAAERADAIRWLAAETRAARLDRRCEIGGA
jgi:hypothetical protein